MYEFNRSRNRDSSAIEFTLGKDSRTVDVLNAVDSSNFRSGKQQLPGYKGWEFLQSDDKV